MSIVFSHVEQTSKYNLKLSFEKRVFETYQDSNCLKGFKKFKKSIENIYSGASINLLQNGYF